MTKSYRRYGPPKYKLDTMDYTATPELQKNMLQYDSSKTTVTRSIQTDYRESESQTDPYSPPYFLPYAGTPMSRFTVESIIVWLGHFML